MKNKQLYLYWLYVYIFCAALGFIQDRSPLVTALLAIASVGFFVPPALLLYRNRAQQNKTLLTVMLIGIGSLVLTMVLFVAYWYALVASGSDLWSNVAYAVLTVFSTPMMCAPWPALSMFLWACLVFAALSMVKKRK